MPAGPQAVSEDLVMNHDVGKWVALGGNAYHLKEATRRLSLLFTMNASDGPKPKLLAGFKDILPDSDKMK